LNVILGEIELEKKLVWKKKKKEKTEGFAKFLPEWDEWHGGVTRQGWRGERKRMMGKRRY